jgi:hypothetical protein
MILQLPISFLRDFFEAVYYSILPDYSVFGKPSSIVLEPVYTFHIQERSVISWEPIEKWNRHDFDITKIGADIEASLASSDSSDIDQVLYPIGNGVFGLFDNPLMYPGERLRELIDTTLVRNPALSGRLDGICHFHPDGTTNLSDADHIAMSNVARAMRLYNKAFVIALIVGRTDSFEYIKRSRLPKNEFLEYILGDRANTPLAGVTFCQDGSTQPIDVRIT